MIRASNPWAHSDHTAGPGWHDPEGLAAAAVLTTALVVAALAPIHDLSGLDAQDAVSTYSVRIAGLVLAILGLTSAGVVRATATHSAMAALIVTAGTGMVLMIPEVVGPTGAVMLLIALRGVHGLTYATYVVATSRVLPSTQPTVF